jgi:hypothetical protein
MLLPAPWNKVFGYYDWLLNDTTVYPDIYYREMDPNEGPRHFIDLGIWNPNSPWTGTLPQSVEEFTGKMQTAIQGKDWNGVFLYAGRVAHYMADAAQPYHTTVNYNPHNRNGVGLHQVLDSALAAHFSEFKILNASEMGTLKPIQNITEFVLETAIQSHSFLSVINGTLIDEGLAWSLELTKIIENRTNTAIAAVARVWYTAIVRAGIQPPGLPRPNLLSLAVENITLNADNLTLIRLNVTDALGVKTFANVTVTLNGQTIRGLVANVVPPIGEYVIILELGTSTNAFIVSAQRNGYETGTVTVNIQNNPTSSLTTQSTTSLSSIVIIESEVVVPVLTIVGLIALFAALLVLIIYRRWSKDN